MKFLPIIILFFLSCERISTQPEAILSSVDTIHVSPVDTVLDCRKNGTCDFWVTDNAFMEIIVAVMNETDTFGIDTLVHGETVYFPGVKAGWFKMYEWDKLTGDVPNLYFVFVDTCQAARAIFEANRVKIVRL